MIEFLAMQVQMGKIVVEQLPERLRALVQERLLTITTSEPNPQKDGE